MGRGRSGGCGGGLLWWYGHVTPVLLEQGERSQILMKPNHHHEALEGAPYPATLPCPLMVLSVSCLDCLLLPFRDSTNRCQSVIPEACLPLRVFWNPASSLPFIMCDVGIPIKGNMFNFKNNKIWRDNPDNFSLPWRKDR